MGIINRFLLLVYALCVSVFSLALAGIALRLVPEGLWLNELRYAAARPETLAVLAVVFLLGVYLMRVALFSRTKEDRAKTSEELVLSDTKQGKVKVAVIAIRELSERSALGVRGVRDAKAKVIQQREGAPIFVALRIIVMQGSSAPDIGSRAAQAVREALSSTLQISDVPVDISVTEISNEQIERKRVV